MKSTICFCLFLTLLSSALSQPTSLSRLSVRGNQFVNESGETVVLRGLNTSDPDKLASQGKWNQSYFQEMKNWGANVVRFPVHPTRLNHRGWEAYLKLLDEGIAWATAHNLYVIIDWHSIGNLKSALFFKPIYETSQKETFEFWRTIAERYGDHPTVAFYELFNEPTTNHGKLGICSWDDWKSINEEMITILRANGGKGIPLVAGFNWAFDLTDAFANPIAAEEIGYVSHPYPQKLPKPWPENWSMNWGLMKQKAPVILTEIGFAGEEEVGAHEPVISDEYYGEAITQYCDEKDISYVIWVFDPQWSPSLFYDWKFQNLSRHGKFFKNQLQSYSE